ncbi:homeobox protein ceh-62-like [Episyrphus balteatus]|uniref:homeobox protein ceh-62-like n=1 Tax=Episyrphus balteatus TaxID=286459 RepID=UPI0024866EAD|nr:homeobox protein ceh-62-like [Episyrphus balteatus]
MRRPRRSRTVFTPDQVAELKYHFMQCNYIRFEKAEQIAAKFSMPVGPVKVWFKNQRRKLKIKENENHILGIGDTTIEPPNYTRHDLILPTLTPRPLTPLSTPSPSISPIEIKFSYDPMYLNSTAYNVKQEPSYNFKHETAYQWLQNLPALTPSQLVYNSASPHHVPQMPSFHDTVINFNRLPYYTLPSPASTTSGDGNHITTNSDTSDYFSQMSPNSEITEPLTPISNHGETESVFNGILDSLKTPETEPLIETVFEELTNAPEQTKIKSEPYIDPISSEHANALEIV